MLKARFAIAAGIVAGFAALLAILGLWRNQNAVLTAAVAALVSMLPLLIGPRQTAADECEAPSAS